MRTDVRSGFGIAAIVLMAGTVAIAQNQSTTFEVGSVKRSTTKQYDPPFVTPQRFHIVATLVDAMSWAYDVRGYQITGGPQWVTRDYFQIEGTTEAPATLTQMRSMLQRLLHDRFTLTLHGESRERRVYFLLTVASGSKPPVATNECGFDSGGCINVAPGEFVAMYATMNSTAAILSNLVDRPVLDRSGLDGHYDFRMKFDPSTTRVYAGQPASRVGPDAPSIFAALQDVGLKLEPRRAPVDTLVIDSAQAPSLD